MKTSQYILACMFCLVVAIREGTSLTCYSCNSFTDKDCAVVGPTTRNVTCSEGQTMCRKVEQHMHYNEGDHIRVFRQCATKGTPGDCDSRTGTYRFKSWYCHCTGSLCNSSGSLTATLALTAAMAVAGLKLRGFL